MEIETNRPKLKRQAAADKQLQDALAEGLKRQAKQLMQKATNKKPQTRGAYERRWVLPTNES